MPEINVNIKWDKPDDLPQWLCPDNIAVALHAHCKNTSFEVAEIVSVDELARSLNAEE